MTTSSPPDQNLTIIEEDFLALAYWVSELSLSWIATTAHCLYTANLFRSSPSAAPILSPSTTSTQKGGAVSSSSSTSVPPLSSSSPSWFYIFVLFFLQGYGGGVLNSFLYSTHILPPFFSNYIVVIAIFCWYAIFKIPFVRNLYNFLPFKIIGYILESLHAIKAITRTVDLVIHNSSSSIFGALVLGTLAGAGGGIWIYVDQHIRNLEHNFKLENNLKLCFMVSSIYYFFAIWFGAIEADSARLLLSIFYAFHLLSNLRAPTNLFTFSDYAFFKITGLNNLTPLVSPVSPPPITTPASEKKRQ